MESKQFYAVWFSIAFLLLQGCVALNNDGCAKDDGAAILCGILGVIAFIASISGRKSGGLAIIGVILILA